jgi:hypothetical protein
MLSGLTGRKKQYRNKATNHWATKHLHYFPLRNQQTVSIIDTDFFVSTKGEDK